MQQPQTPRLFCFGLGFSPLAFIDLTRREHGPEGWRIAGTTRSPDKAAAHSARGIETHLFDRGRPLDDAAAALAGTTHLLTAVPPDADGDPVLDHHAADIAALMPGLRWVGYLSTTGVYGDHDGAWVDESTPLQPTGRRQKQRAAAEQAWLRLRRDHEVPVHLFRLAGIYGPGRSVIDSVRNGTARRIDKPGQVFSRIHVDDIARTLRASIDRPNPGAAYNLCDDNPAPGHEVTAFACELLGVEPPPLVPFDRAELSPMAASFYADNKKVRNDRIKDELGVTLKYPDYRPALRDQLRQEGRTED
ncbi:SDR family oxidoreductase [Skermanella pratensis]|uniref:SDR family oxidoreductase n=1 Tax=Skermanella pratensis TaxID=2233999 RepID=UPI0013017B45|nr:SDR family oxidoreductase [Skermanella pratensis]